MMMICLSVAAAQEGTSLASCDAGDTTCEDWAIQKELDEAEPALELLQVGKSAIDEELAEEEDKSEINGVDDYKCNHACGLSNWYSGRCTGDTCNCYGGKSKGPHHIRGTGADLCHKVAPQHWHGNSLCNTACGRSNWHHGKCEGWNAKWKTPKCNCYGGKGPGPHHLEGVGMNGICKYK